MVKSFLKATSSALQVKFFSYWSKFIQSRLYICSVLLVKLCSCFLKDLYCSPLWQTWVWKKKLQFLKKCGKNLEFWIQKSLQTQQKEIELQSNVINNPNPCHISSLDLLINGLSLKYESVAYTQEIFLVFLTARGVLLVFTCKILTKFLSMWFSFSDGLHCVTYRVHVFWNLNEEEQLLRQTM